MTDTLTAANNNSVTTSALTVGNRVFALVAAVYGSPTVTNGSLSSPPSDGHNTYTSWVSATTLSGHFTILSAIYSAPITVGGAQTIAATVSGGGSDNVLGIGYLEYSGLDLSAGTGAMDASGSHAFAAVTATGTATSSTTTAANQLVLSLPVNDNDNTDAFSWSSGSPTETKITAASFDSTGIANAAVAEGTLASGTTASAAWTISASDTGLLTIAVARLAVASPVPARPKIWIPTYRASAF
jgi:hypothetical protein